MQKLHSSLYPRKLNKENKLVQQLQKPVDQNKNVLTSAN
jgi:hypothetical protein